MKKRLKLYPIRDAERFQDLLVSGELTLGELLDKEPALSGEAIDPALMNKRIDDLRIQPFQMSSTVSLFVPPGMSFRFENGSSVPSTETEKQTPKSESQPAEVQGSANDQDSSETPERIDIDPSTSPHPERITDREAVELAYTPEIDSVASFLRANLSVLVVCEKLVVDYLWPIMASKAKLEPQVLEVPEDPGGGGLMPQSQRQRQLAALKQLVKSLATGHLLVIPHLDLLAGGSDSNLSTESREMIELVYERSDRLILAFADKSLGIPEVLADRFAVRMTVSGVPREVVYPDGTPSTIGKAFVTKDESTRFTDFDPDVLYKNVAGMNPVRLRNAIQYAKQEHSGKELIPALRAFKAQTSTRFEVPNVKFSDIGGYESVKRELAHALNLMAGAYQLDNPDLQTELIPRGFIFHGPAGTGKTLFAKAIASELDATIQVVSGPEVTDMYVGESERKVRELFDEARRNAPAVLVFDEIDSIATERTGRGDGGARAGNALVAQILTEMDGFRPDVQMLVIGTTNRLDIIDKALLRPSRFKPIAIGLPNTSARRAIAKVHAKHFGIDVSDALLQLIADKTESFNGDEIRSLFRDAFVAWKCLEERTVPDARQFGRLVGRIRRAADEQRSSTDANRTTVLETTPPGQRPRPSSGHVTLVAAGNETKEESKSDEETT